jgi:hypothetical protein
MANFTITGMRELLLVRGMDDYQLCVPRKQVTGG